MDVARPPGSLEKQYLTVSQLNILKEVSVLLYCKKKITDSSSLLLSVLLPLHNLCFPSVVPNSDDNWLQSIIGKIMLEIIKINQNYSFKTSIGRRLEIHWLTLKYQAKAKNGSGIPSQDIKKYNNDLDWRLDVSKLMWGCFLSELSHVNWKTSWHAPPTESRKYS